LPAVFASCIACAHPASAVTAALVASLSFMATWRSGYATVCKTSYFAFIVNIFSENQSKFDGLPVNGLSDISE
jgi:hypothetical protein